MTPFKEQNFLSFHINLDGHEERSILFCQILFQQSVGADEVVVSCSAQCPFTVTPEETEWPQQDVEKF